MSNFLFASPNANQLLLGHKTQPESDRKCYAERLLTWDILCGTDKRFEKQPGNIKYQEILHMVRPAYMSIESKSAKKKMIRDIDEYIQSYGGRFLRIDELNARLRLLTKAEARNKISRSLRENVCLQKDRRIFVAKIRELDVLCGRGMYIMKKYIMQLSEQYNLHRLQCYAPQTFPANLISISIFK